MAATNIAQSPEEQQKKAQQTQQANNTPVQAQTSTTTATTSIGSQQAQTPAASPIAKTDAGDIDLTADVKTVGTINPKNYYKEAAKQQEENAKKYEEQARPYAPESKEDAQKRARKERIGLIHAGVFDGLAALSNFWAANRGVAGAYDASKGTSVAMGTAFEKAQQHREQNRQIYDNYMDKAKAAQLSANQLLQQWRDKEEERELQKSQLDMARQQFDAQMDEFEYNKTLRPAKTREANANAETAEINAQTQREYRGSIIKKNVAAALKGNKAAAKTLQNFGYKIIKNILYDDMGNRIGSITERIPTTGGGGAISSTAPGNNNGKKQTGLGNVWGK